MALPGPNRTEKQKLLDADLLNLADSRSDNIVYSLTRNRDLSPTEVVDVVRALLKEGAKIDSTDNYDRTALHFAADKGNVPVMKVLMKAGAQPNARSLFGDTPLDSAVYKGQTDAIHLLLDNGAKISAPGGDGRTPFLVAASAGQMPSMLLLLGRGAVATDTENNGRNALHLLATSSHATPAAVKFLRGEGVSITDRDKGGNTVLHLAADRSNRRVMEAFVAAGMAAGVDINAENGIKRTALHEAARSTNSEAVAELLQREAKVNLQDEDGQTALHLAIRNAEIVTDARNEPYHPEVNATVQQLLAKGADLTIKNKKGQTPLDIARQHLADAQAIPENFLWRQHNIEEARAFVKLLEDAQARASGRQAPIEQNKQEPGQVRQKSVTPASLDRDGDKKITAKDFDLNGNGILDEKERAAVKDAFAALKDSLNPAAIEAVAQIRDIAAANNIVLREANATSVAAPAAGGKGPSSGVKL